MPTLRQVATQVAYDLNRPYDNILIKRLSDLILQEAAKFLRQSIERNGADKSLVLTYIETLTVKDISVNTSIIDANQNLLRTTNKIYNPIRTKGDSPFLYVGSIDFSKPIKYSPSNARLFDKYLPNVGCTPSYDYINQYLYFYNLQKMKYIAIRALFENPLDVFDSLLSGDTSDTTNFCVEDHALPIPMDILNDIKKSLLAGELKVTDDKDKVEATHLDNT